MPFDLTTWKNKFAACLPGWKARMQQAGVTSVYAGLSAAALWPVVEAARNGEWAALSALGGVLASLGSNLLANQIQSWKDESDAARQIEASVEDNAVLRAELDAVLQTLDALSLAQVGLTDADKAWFVETLRQELPRLGSSLQVGDIYADGSTVNIAGGNLNQFKVEAGGQAFIFYGFQHPAAAKTENPNALRNYLDYLVAEHQHLHLQGIRSGSQALSVALEKVYISLSITDQQMPTEKQAETGRMKRGDAEEAFSGGWFRLARAMQRYKRLVITGDPGCGKTTLLAYLALTYARALRDGQDWVQSRLGLTEAGYLPVLLPLRDLGRHVLETRPEPGKDGPALLLDFLRTYYQMQEIDLPEDFFRGPLESGQAVVLLDGMDEVADSALRQRMARLIERFIRRYPRIRCVVTSRIVGYTGAARVAEGFGLGRVRELTQAEARQFIQDWQRAVETTLSGSEAPEILKKAERQAESLIQAIEQAPRVAELALNPLLLTVIALVHRYRARLPERRADLYEEAIEVLLGYWDEAKGLEVDMALSDGRKLDAGDQRGLLEPVAFWLHERQQREIELDDLRGLLLPRFTSLARQDEGQAAALFKEFLRLVAERSGMLLERGTGMYGFAHLTFQEYLAARALADRADGLDYTVQVLADPWWREVVLLQAAYLSNQGQRRVSELLRAIARVDTKNEPEPLQSLALAAECMLDIGEARLEADVPDELRRRLKKYADTPLSEGKKDRPAILRKIVALNTLDRLQSGQAAPRFWKLPWGEPEWVLIPAGEFWMGSGEDDKQADDEEKPLHKLFLPEYRIAITPVTNAQYALYIADTGGRPPQDWNGEKPPRGLENHPVANISWHGAPAYCRWLSEKIRKNVSLPSEAEWEKAARGDQEARLYPWGDDWRELHCNSSELGLGDTTPVGLFLNGASPYGVLDLSGNVWEWTRSIAREWDPKRDKVVREFNYPYTIEDGREDVTALDNFSRVLRGGSFDYGSWYVRCAFRLRGFPNLFYWRYGFRVCLPHAPQA
ncbi:MAG: SUMF1/EgtB/PvdO family nonheme iron enzyme [Anaerolineales bacterium]|nr:SUMF1/EgtB/PvdO family nonheme iron enzyme [Anaerolineales bacterium]